jgi:integrase
MYSFKLSEYKKENTNTKIKVLIEFLYERFGTSADSEDFDNIYFSLFNDNDLIQSLEYYIDKNKVTAQITASNYIHYITSFFKMLSEKYNIENDMFINIEQNKQLIAKSKEIISKLRKTVSKDNASDEQYEDLVSGIEDFLNNFNINDLYDEIIKCKNSNKYTKLYHRFVSIIPIKLIIKFALSNLRVISLEYSDLDMGKNTLLINGLQLPLDKELIELFKQYLRVREYILNLYSKQETKLFVKNNGEPYIKNTADRKNVPAYASFFRIMKDNIKTESAELFANRRILDMLDHGIDISTIIRISEKSAEKCIELQNSNNKEDDVINKLNLFFNEDTNKKIEVKKKEYINCPICGKEVKAISDELVLVQYITNDTKYLACKNCRGEYGKHSI